MIEKLTDTELTFAEIIWKEEPISSGELVQICKTELNWKKSTMYTMLKRLERKGIFQNQNGIVSALVKKDTFYSIQSNHFVEKNFDGSLPRFLTAFTRSKKLNQQEIEEIQKLIDDYKEE